MKFDFRKLKVRRVAFKVCYVDDEADLCENFSDAFANENVEVICFTDPQVALHSIKSAPPDFLFLDYRMPGLNGLELVKELNPQYPVVLITGEINLQTSFPFLKILSKPYSIDVISSLIEQKAAEKVSKS